MRDDDLSIRSRSDLDEPVFEIVHRTGGVISICSSLEQAEQQLRQFQARPVERAPLPTRGGDPRDRANNMLRAPENVHSADDALDEKLGITLLRCPQCGMVTDTSGGEGNSTVRCRSCRASFEMPVAPENLQSTPVSTKAGPLFRIAAAGAILVIVGVFAWMLIELMDGNSGNGESIRLSESENVQNNQLRTVTEDQLRDIVEHARDIADAYSKARTIKEKSRFVRQPERVVPEMNAHEARQSKAVSIKRVGFGSATVIRNPNGGAVFLMTQAEFEDFTQSTIVFELLENDGLLIDWEGLVGYCDMSWGEFMKVKPATPQVFRIVLERGDYYAHDFDDPRNELSFRIADLAGKNVVHGYVSRFDRVSSSLFSLFQLANQPRVAVTLTLAYPDNAGKDNQVRIVSLLSPNWVLGYGFRDHEVLATLVLDR